MTIFDGVRALFLIGALVVFSAWTAPFARAADRMFVPQLGLTPLNPIDVSLHPTNPDLLLVVDEDGRISLIDHSNKERPLTRLEIFSGAVVARFRIQGDEVTSVVSGGRDGTVRVWDLETGQQIGDPLTGHESWVWSVALSADGTRAVSGGEDGTVRVWNLETGQQIGDPLTGHENWVLSVALSADGTRAVSGGRDGTVRVWDLETGQQIGDPLTGHENWVLSVALSADGTRAVSGGRDGTVRVWDLETGQQIGDPLTGHEKWVMSVALSADGTRAVSGGSDGTVRVWDLETGQQIGDPLTGHENWVWSVALSADGTRAVSGSEDGTVRVWDLETGQQIGDPLTGHENWVWSVALSADGTRAVSGGRDGTVRVWDLETGQQIGDPLTGHESSVMSVALSADGTRAVSGGSDGTVRVWDLETGQQIGDPLTGHENWVWSVALSADGTRAVSGGRDGTVRVWDLETGQQIGDPLTGHESSVMSVALSADGTRAVSGGSDGTVRVWDLETGQQIGDPLTGHEKWVMSVALSADGTRAVSGGRDRTVRVWDLETGQQIGDPLTGHEDWVRSVALSADGTRAVSGGWDGTVRVWDLESGTNEQGLLCRSDAVFFVPQTPIVLLCSGRLLFVDSDLVVIGQIFLVRSGAVAIVRTEGVAFSTDEVVPLIKTVARIDGRPEILANTPRIDFAEARAILFDDLAILERFRRTLDQTIADLMSWYEAQESWLKLSIWPAMAVLLAWMSALGAWLFVPSRLCHWMLPIHGGNNPPPVKLVMEILSLFRWFAATGRARCAWLRRHRAPFEADYFQTREPVRERERYAALASNAALPPPQRGQRLVAWVHGVGGSGKSAFAFAFAREHLFARHDQPMPILIAENWEGTLPDHLARLLRLDGWRGRGPTPEMIRFFGRRGLICPIIDSLSERTVKGAAAQVEGAITSGAFRHLIVTSRFEPPQSQAWEKASVVNTQPLTPEDVPLFVERYIDDPARRPMVEARIAPLVAPRTLQDRGEKMPSPLFLRFAIEQAATGELGSISRIDLVQRYVEAGRKGRVDVNADDFLRAAGIVAIEAIRSEELTPGERAVEFLRGVLMTEADTAPFMDDARENPVNPSRLIADLLSCGILNQSPTNKLVQFAYDPVAEYLAAWRLNSGPPNPTVNALVAAKPKSELAAALRELRGDRVAA